MSLGIYDRLWQLLQGACNSLDLLLAKYSCVGTDNSSFQEYIVALRKREKLEHDLATADKRVSAVDQLVSFCTIHCPDAENDPGLKVIREASPRSLLAVAAVVIKSTKLHTHKR